jgi:hypothetical protein
MSETRGRHTRRSLLALVLVIGATTPWLLGARRVTGTGCGGTTLGRFLQAEQPGPTRTTNLIGDGTRTTTITRARVSNLDAQTINWRADPNAFVDVFFADMDEDGIEYAPMVRYEWPLGIYGRDIVTEQPTADIAALDPRLQFETRTAGVIRFYDRGACSGSTSWRSFGESLAPVFDVAFDEAIKDQADDPACSARSNGPWSITPILRREAADGTNQDSFRFARPFLIDVCAGGDAFLTVGFEGRFETTDGALAFVVLDAFANGQGAEDAVASLMDPVNGVGPAITAAVPQVIGTVIPNPVNGAPLFSCDPDAAVDPCLRTARGAIVGAYGVPRDEILARNLVCVPASTSQGGACAFVPNVHRVYERPDGIELVLSEWDANEDTLHAADPGYYGEADPFYPLLASADACVRDELYVPARIGYLGPVREDPFPGLPAPFGDTP